MIMKLGIFKKNKQKERIMSLFKKIKVTKKGVYLLDPTYQKKFNKLTLSPSTIDSWLKSPADFVLNKFVLPEVSEQEEKHFTRGKWFHSTMEEFFKLNKEERNIPSLLKVAKKVTDMEEYKEFSKEKENQEWYSNILKLYANHFLSIGQKEKIAKLPIMGSSQIGLELSISGKVAETERRCFGYIDKIVEGENGLIVQDWKTGKHVDDFNPNKPISVNNPFGYWRQQTLYSMLLEKEGAVIEGACLIFPLATTIVNVDQSNKLVREQVIKDVIQTDKEMTEAVENNYFFPFKKGKYNSWSSWLGGLGSAKRPNIIEGKFMNIADLSEIM